MAEGTISIGDTTLDTPSGYSPKLDFLKVYERTPYGILIINRNANIENQPISIYKFEVADVVNSKMLAIRAEAAHISNLYYVDYLLIVEVLSGDGTTKTFYTQRQLNTKTDPVPIVTVGGVSKSPTITENVSGRGRFVFTDAPADVDDNIIIQYEPKFIINIVDYIHTYRIMNIAHYTLICEEVKP